jgi:hypothetical protein
MKFARLTTVIAACFVALAATSSAATRPKDLWATVNVCDTANHPDMMGVRASMPGDGERTTMWMRFAAQYYSRSKQMWLDVKGDGLSKWIKVGSGIYARRQAGYTFAFSAPGGGRTFVLRGVVYFEWRKAKRVVRSARVSTKGGHPNTPNADPKTFSAGICEIR